MVLSVVIVNYNVKYFLEQCLCSVEKALQEAGGAGGGPGAGHLASETEIIVVDNNSRDGSVEYLRSRFPGVRFIVNEDNKGFSRANNQALEEAGGKYILFLNPDTIVPEGGIHSCISFLELTPGAGALGVRMVDGSGRFLKESFRGFPTPWAAFCKLTGLTALFPHSRWLARYYLGHLPENKNHPAPVLSGAFFLVSRAVLDLTGGFDERFFMYAEDIDLSYRIEQAGYTNYYLADVTILHFKGESTLKDMRYVRLFYKAMSQFRRKHFTGAFHTLFNSLMDIAIWCRAGIAATGHIIVLAAGGEKKGASVPVGKGDPAKGNTAAGGYRTWIEGDPLAVRETKAVLKSFPERALESDRQLANEVIFCQGRGFSFRQVIDALQKFPPGISCKVHAGGTSSAVGSDSGDSKGQVLVLE